MYLRKPITTPIPEGQIIVKQSGGVGILIEECANKSYIIEKADYIIEGIIEKVESKWNEERTSIFTYTDLVIEKYVKGTPLNFVTKTPLVKEIREGKFDDEGWEAALRDADREGIPLFAFIDWAGDGTPMAIFSQELNTTQQKEFLIKAECNKA